MSSELPPEEALNAGNTRPEVLLGLPAAGEVALSPEDMTQTSLVPPPVLPASSAVPVRPSFPPLSPAASLEQHAPSHQPTHKAPHKEGTKDFAGRVIGHYQLVRELGRGGMGRVYLAYDQRLGRRVALKLLLRQATRNPERVLRFRQEARAASALNHPNILTIYDIGELKDVHYLATEYVEGKTLRTLLEAGALTLTTVLQLILQAAEALAVAHEAGIVHRDIKPENLMVRPDGYLKVLDFGIAKLTESATGSARAGEIGEAFDQYETKPGVVIGTVHYMSPEQARGLRVDQRTDIFSLGVVLYEMVTGKKPFVGPTPSDVVAAVLTAEPPPLTKLLAGAPPGLQVIITRALKKEREYRYTSARALIADLHLLQEELRFHARIYAAPGTNGEKPLAASAVNLSIASSNRHEVAVDATTSKVELAPSLPLSDTANAAARRTGKMFFWQRPFAGARSGTRTAVWQWLLFLLLFGVGAWLWWQRTAPRSDSIAVLPFVQVSAASATEGTANKLDESNVRYLADGLTENLIQRLSQTPALKVIARNSVYRYQHQNADPQEVGQEFNVRTVLNGRVQAQGDALQINVELVDASSRAVLWNERYMRSNAEAASLSAEIAHAIAARLHTRVSSETQQRLTRRDTSNSVAYQHYLRGRYHWNQRTAEALLKSLDDFQAALQQDSDYARAYAGLADTYALLSTYSDIPQTECYDKGQAAAARALALDPQMAEPHAALALMLNTFKWDWQGAEREFQLAIQRNPNYATAHHWYGSFLTQQGRFDEALRQTALASELDPVSQPIATAHGATYYHARRVDEAIAQFKKALLLNPNAAGVRAHLAMAYESRADWPNAFSEIKRAVELSNNNPAMRARLAHVYAATGQPAAARQVLGELVAKQAEQPVSSYLLAEVHAALGDQDAAFAALAQAVAGRDNLVVWLKTEPRLDNLRQDQRFTKLLQQVGLQP